MISSICLLLVLHVQMVNGRSDMVVDSGDNIGIQIHVPNIIAHENASMHIHVHVYVHLRILPSNTCTCTCICTFTLYACLCTIACMMIVLCHS